MSDLICKGSGFKAERWEGVEKCPKCGRDVFVSVGRFNVHSPK